MATMEWKKTKDGIEANLSALVTRGRSVSSYLNRYIYPAYQQAQIDRWMSQNSSQGETWRELNPDYLKRKKVKYAAYPGAGNVVMVATGALASAAQGEGPGRLKIVTDRSMTVGVDSSAIPYAVYAAKDRPFMDFSDETVSKWTNSVFRYIMTGEVGL